MRSRRRFCVAQSPQMLKFSSSVLLRRAAIIHGPVNQMPHHNNWTYHKGNIYGTGGKFVEKLDVSTGTWTRLPDLSVWRVCASLGVVRGRLFVVGVAVRQSIVPYLTVATASVEQYLPREDVWVAVPDLPIAVARATVVALDNKLLVIGGSDSDAVLEYDPANQTWKTLPHLLEKRSEAAVTVLEGNVVVMGGYAVGGSPLRSVERYNLSTGQWEVMPSLTNVIHNPAAVVI